MKIQNTIEGATMWERDEHEEDTLVDKHLLGKRVNT